MIVWKTLKTKVILDSIKVIKLEIQQERLHILTIAIREIIHACIKVKYWY